MTKTQPRTLKTRARLLEAAQDIISKVGYEGLRTQDVVAIFEAAGFELADTSEVNANPRDPANWEGGVWTLPPVLATGADDPRRAEYQTIGESDRMTLLFKKAD